MTTVQEREVDIKSITVVYANRLSQNQFAPYETFTNIINVEIMEHVAVIDYLKKDSPRKVVIPMRAIEALTIIYPDEPQVIVGDDLDLQDEVPDRDVEELRTFDGVGVRTVHGAVRGEDWG